MLKQFCRRMLSLCLAGAMLLGLLPPVSALAAQPGESSLKICVISDSHYYPLNYVSDCPDYNRYIDADPKLLAESGAILDEAVRMIAEDQPDLILVSGDLTKDGEKQAHLEMAERLRALEQAAGAPVYVINGNHDVYNYSGACTFENGYKEAAETVTPDEFRAIYAEFGYDGAGDAVYYLPPEGKQAGGLSYAVTVEEDYLLLALDSCMYSPDATGLAENQQVTGGRLDEDLLAWAEEQIAAAEAEGKTVVGLMHHALLPHFGMEAELLSEYIVEDWEQAASALADAGLRYLFTGHMHANDIAEYTTLEGNRVVDIETGSLSSWGSPVRTVTLEKGAPLGDGTPRTHESLTVSSRGIKSITFRGVTIADFPAYTVQHLYAESMLSDLVRERLAPLLEDIGNRGVQAVAAELAPGLDLDAAVLNAVQDALLGGKQLELGWGIGRVYVRYRDGAVRLSPSGAAGLVGEITVTDAQILEAVNDLLDQAAALCRESPDLVLDRVASAMGRLSESGVAGIGTAEEKSFYDFLLYVLLSHDAGAENAPDWVREAQSYIQSGRLVTNILQVLLEEATDLVQDLAAHLILDPALLLGRMWEQLTGVKTSLQNLLEVAGLDVRTILDGLVGEYMSDSFLSGMGGLLEEMAGSFIDDPVPDDVLDGEARTILFDGTAEKPAPTAENGLLPDQITMTLGAEAETDRAFSWYTGVMVSTGAVQLSRTADFAEAVTLPAQSTEEERPCPLLNLGLFTTYTTKTVRRHTVRVTGLEPDAAYYYRVGCPEQGWWSETACFTTGDPASDSFTFLNLNDSQGMIRSDYETYLDALARAQAQFPGAAFLLHAGDFVDDGSNENYWSMVLDSAASHSMAILPSAGNHEARSSVPGVTQPGAISAHFDLSGLENFPQQDTAGGVYYSFEYQNALFIVLNTNDLTGETGGLSDEQLAWALETARQSDADWKILMLHRSTYSNGPHAEDDDVEALRPQIDRLAALGGIDLVLGGHDHVYNRTPWLSWGAEMENETVPAEYGGETIETAVNPVGAVFVTAGTAGVKNYTQTLLDAVPSAAAFDLSCPVYAGVTIEGQTLVYRAYKVENGESVLIDSFAIDKTGAKARPGWQKAGDLIRALPELPDLPDAGAVEQARAAFDALSPEEQALVPGTEKLAEAERILAALETIAAGQAVTVSTPEELEAALADPAVTALSVAGTLDFADCLGRSRTLTVSRDLCIRGTGELRHLELEVREGAALVLEGSVYLNGTRGLVRGAADPVSVYEGSALIVRGSAQIRAERDIRTGAAGYAVRRMDPSALVRLSGAGTIWGETGTLGDAGAE